MKRGVNQKKIASIEWNRLPFWRRKFWNWRFRTEKNKKVQWNLKGTSELKKAPLNLKEMW